MTRNISLIPQRKASFAAAAMILLLSSTAGAWSADLDPRTAPKRPAIKTNRWQEDWSVLSDPSLRTEPIDGLKYILLYAAAQAKARQPAFAKATGGRSACRDL